MVREIEDGYQIIDGEHRFVEMKELGATMIAVVSLGHISDGKAKMLTMVLNEVHGNRNPVLMSNLLNELKLEADWDRTQLLLPLTDSEIEALLAISVEDPEEGGKKKRDRREPAPSTGWIDLKVRVHSDEYPEIEKLIGKRKAELGVEKKPDPALENGILFKELITRH